MIDYRFFKNLYTYEPVSVIINSRYYYIVYIIKDIKYIAKCKRQNIHLIIEYLLHKYGSCKVIDIKQEGHPKAKYYKKLIKHHEVNEIIFTDKEGKCL